MSKKLFVLAGLAALFVSPALAGDVKGEIVTAIQHAQYAAEAADIATVHMHLHHTLNCIVGPNGNGFDANQMNPCANAGSGIIPGTMNVAAESTLDAATMKALAGLASNDIKAAKADATEVENALKTLQ
jgi:hypothetical protein